MSGLQRGTCVGWSRFGYGWIRPDNGENNVFVRYATHLSIKYT